MVYKNEITIIGYKSYARNADIPNYVVKMGCPLYNNNTKDLVIPREINGLPVVAIGDYAFEDNQLTNVVIPDSVKTIGDYAFAKNELTEVIIPKSVKEIKKNVFDENVKIIKSF
jgi:hypothetical protein